MSKRLPKATLKPLSDIQRENVPPVIIDVVAERLVDDPAQTVVQPQKIELESASSELRLSEARLIVQRHTSYAAMGGCLPLAILDALSVGLIIFNMVRELAAHYQVAFQKDQAKALIAAMLGGVLSPGLGSLATHLISKVVPGGWLFGVAASSATAAAFTRCSGEVFVEHFESGGNLLDVDLSRIRAYFSQSQTAAG